MMEDLIFYDLEVFKYDSLCVLMDEDETEIDYFWSEGYDDEKIQNGFVKGSSAYHERPLIDYVESYVMVGYNNYHYDDIVIQAMINDRPQKYIKALNDFIITGADSVSSYSWCHALAKNIKSFDASQQLLTRPSLKQIEANMGIDIRETSVPFDIDRPLTEEEKEEVLRYCCHDVRSTIKVWKERKKSYFETKYKLVEMLADKKGVRSEDREDWIWRTIKYNTTTISAMMLKDVEGKAWAGYGRIPESIRNMECIDPKVRELWCLDECATAVDMLESARAGRLEGRMDIDRAAPPKGRKVITTAKLNAYGCEIVYGFGGLHGVDDKHKHEFENVYLADVGSMYPSIINAISALDESTEYYDGIRKERLIAKHEGDKVRSDALKLILNSVYGNLKNQYSVLQNPWASTCVCIYGQIALTELTRMLYEEGYQPMNLNTDGVAFTDPNGIGLEAYETVRKEWEGVFNLTLELDTFTRWIQKDVNNYVAVKPNGKIKVKGGETNKYAEDNLFSNNSARIIQMAVVHGILQGNTDDLIGFIKDHRNEPKLFQYVLKAGSTYLGTGTETELLDTKVNRVFAANEFFKNSTRLYKVRPDGERVNYPDMPERMWMYNDDCSHVPDFNRYLDVGHYYKIAMKKLEAWDVH